MLLIIQFATAGSGENNVGKSTCDFAPLRFKISFTFPFVRFAVPISKRDKSYAIAKSGHGDWCWSNFPVKSRVILYWRRQMVPPFQMDCHNQSNGADGCILVLTGFELCLAVFALIAWITVRRARRNFVAKTENEGGEGSRGLISLRQGNSVVRTQLTDSIGTT